MILGLEIGMLIVGILALVRGELRLTPTRVVRGEARKIAAVLLLAPVPLTYFLAGFVTAGRVPRFPNWNLIALEAAVAVGCLILAGALAYFAGEEGTSSPVAAGGPSPQPYDEWMPDDVRARLKEVEEQERRRREA